MRRILTLCFTILLASWAQAQSPEKMSYQLVLRDANNVLISEKLINMQISILQGSISGSAVYVETQTTTTNINGLASVEIGNGTIVSGGFNSIKWENGPYFVKTETDTSGGNNYSISTVNAFKSVPYAFHAKTADKIKNDFYLGQDTLGGIVFYIKKDKNGEIHGLIVNHNENSLSCQMPASLDGATSYWDGASNTSLMTNSPAAAYTLSLGAGWYLPSADELSLLGHSRYIVNKALFKGNYTLLQTEGYQWSSTQYPGNTIRQFGYGYTQNEVTYTLPQGTYTVRAIRAF